MKNLVAITLIAVLMMLSFAGSIYAEDKIPGMSIYLQGGYTYNLENPDSGISELRLFDQKANTFTADLAQIVFTKDAAVNGVGYRLKLSAGETAKAIHALGLGTADDSFDLTEAYVSYITPAGKGLRFDFGKFVTYHGAEVIEAKDSPNYSRSLLFNFAIPFTHTGLKMSYSFSDTLSAGIHIVNGWDNFNDNNKGKTIGLRAAYAPVTEFSTMFNLMYGPEKDDDTADKRFLFDWVGTIKLVSNFTLIINADYATEDKSAADGGKAKWYGIAGIAKYDFSGLFSASVRAEYFNDKDGVRTLTVQKLKEITLTPEIRLAGLIIRPEYRHDWSDEEVFKSGEKKSHDTIALGVMYTW